MLDPHTDHCRTYFKLITQFKASFGEQFDSFQFAMPQGGFASGADLRHARSGCELWEARGWHWVCHCQKGPAARLRFLAHSDASDLAGVAYRVALGDGGTAGGRSNGSAYSLSLSQTEAAQAEAVELTEL